MITITLALLDDEVRALRQWLDAAQSPHFAEGSTNHLPRALSALKGALSHECARKGIEYSKRNGRAEGRMGAFVVGDHVRILDALRGLSNTPGTIINIPNQHSVLVELGVGHDRKRVFCRADQLTLISEG